MADAWQGLLTDGAASTVRLTTPEPEGALAALTAGEVDLAVVHSYSNIPRSMPDGIEIEPLVVEPVWLVIAATDPVAVAAAEAGSIDLAALAGHPWITPERGLTCYEMTDRACGLAGFRPHIVAQSRDYALYLRLVAAGVGVALIPDLAADPVPAGVVLAATSTRLTRRTVAARRSARHADPGLDRITALLRSCAAARVRSAAPVFAHRPDSAPARRPRDRQPDLSDSIRS